MRRDAPPSPASASLIDRILVAVLIVGCAWFYFGAALHYPNRALSHDPEGYYGLQTAGFRSGHLYVALQPNPALLALPDPYDPVQNAPYRVHDMSLWKGRYYLYFGVTPAIAFFWPVQLLTGSYPTEAFAVATFSFIGTLTAVALFLAVRRRYFPLAPRWAIYIGVLCVAFASPISLLNQRPQFYQVAIAGAFVFEMAMLAAIYRALHARRQAPLLLAAASLAYGLMIGARPNHILEGFLLVLAVGGVVWQHRGRFRAASRATLLASAFGPAAAMGTLLLLYNWARFDRFSEFGMTYQLAGMKVSTQSPMALENFRPHLMEYLFNPGTWSRYFPFFTPPSGIALGTLRYYPWLWLAPLAFLAASVVLRTRRTSYGFFISILLGSVVLNLGLLSFFFGTTTERYRSDFVPVWLLLAGIAAVACATILNRRTLIARIALLGIAGAGIFSLFVGLAAFANGLPQDGSALSLARAANWPTYAWERVSGKQLGGMRLEIELPATTPTVREPLIETGRSSNERDWVWIDYLPSNRARIGFFHAGMGELAGADFAIPANRRLVVEVRSGALLPPFEHPVFSGWTREKFNVVERDLQIRVNGTETLRTVLACYDSPPNSLLLGQLAWPTGGASNRFSGRIISATRNPIVNDDLPPAALKEAVPVELTLLFPADRPHGVDPIFATGSGVKSDLLYCIYDGANRVKLAIDHYGAGGPQSEAIEYDPLVPHRLLVWMGSLGGPRGTSADLPWSQRLVVLFDGKVILNSEQAFYPATPETAVFGFNAYGSTAASRQFGGRLVNLSPVSFSALPAGEQKGYGAIEMTLMFPLHVPGIADPIVVTGKTGAGDLIYVQYVDPRHVRFGFDHWGVGGFVGEPVEIDYGSAHRLEVTMGSLYAPPGPEAWRQLVRVKLDGKTVLAGKSKTHPAAANQITLGANPIGGSTCGAQFNGKVISVERLPEPRS